MSEHDFLTTKNKIRKNHFLMKIRNARNHRVAFLYKMFNDDLTNLGDWSFLSSNNGDPKPSILGAIRDYGLKNIDIEKVANSCKNFPHLLQSEQDNSYDKINAWTDTHFKPHVDSYFEICFETFVHGEHQSLTEKIFKPIANFQPFFFVAYPNALKLLKDLGFKTFDGFIDESYDDVSDFNLRLDMIYNEVKRLCQMSKEEIHQWYWSMEDILIHNHKTLINYHKNKIYGEDLIAELSNMTNNRMI